MYRLLRPLLFRLEPERAHRLTLRALQLAGAFPYSRWLLRQRYRLQLKPVQAFGLSFSNPVGLAAGYDKDAIAARGLTALGFGHIEIGTVTPKPQPGNPRPRLFRLTEDEAVINRLGFPSQGSARVAQRLNHLELGPGARSSKNRTILGVNLGKNKQTALESAAEDYVSLMKTFTPLADYLTINISSPNTLGLRRLQGRDMLEGLLAQIAQERDRAQTRRPMLVKISPDLSDEELADAVGVILDQNMDGLIATNTTLARDGLQSRFQGETGGLSGRPLQVRSETVLRQVVAQVDGRIPVISVGGISSAENVQTRLDLGATLVQVYTGLIYHGPGFLKKF